MDRKQILAEWEQKVFRPVYWFEGDESFFIDELVSAAESKILSIEEAAFNLIVHYGKDTSWSQLLNSCMRYPMFAEKQLVILKEAQYMKEIEMLESYISKPLSSTILIVAYKEKKIDGRSKFAKLLKENAGFFSSSRIKENELYGWVEQYLNFNKYQATSKAIFLITEHIGNDLGRIANELDKLFIHLGDRKSLNEDDVEACIGISKEYNLFELQKSIGQKQYQKSFQIIQYFEDNPKAAPIQMLLPVLYAYFSKVYMILSAKGDEKTIAAKTGINNWFLKEYRQTASIYGYQGVENSLLLLHAYNLKSVGVNANNNSDAALLKELLAKMMLFS
jgi:DNA polymerase-3 subunit delta